VCASVTWNSVMMIGYNKLEHIQRKFSAFAIINFQDMEYFCVNLLGKLHLLTLYIRRHHSAVFFNRCLKLP
jgi:hypothetical protein